MKKEFTTAAEELITGIQTPDAQEPEAAAAGDQSKADHGRAAAERFLYALCRSKDRKSKLPVFKKPCKEAHSRGEEPQNVKEWAYQCHS